MLIESHNHKGMAVLAPAPTCNKALGKTAHAAFPCACNRCCDHSNHTTDHALHVRCEAGVAVCS